MENFSADITVIGTGPAGQKAAIQAAKLNKTVLIIENEGCLGGACLNSGTIPSKTLRAAILDLTDFYSKSFYSDEIVHKEIRIKDLNHRLHQVVSNQKKIIERQLLKNKITLIYGQAEFEGPKIVCVRNSSNQLFARIKTEYVIVASGSTPRNPQEVPFDGHRILDSTSLLTMKELPTSMLVLGSGVIGSEYASFFAALGVEVNVIDKKDHMLSYIDREIGVHLQNGLEEIGLKFFGQKKVEKIFVENDKACVLCDGDEKYCADVLLYALGRQANVDNLRVENAGISLSPRGYIHVNSLFQTQTPNIYAVGDVIGGACLASTSMEQGRLAALGACSSKTHHFPELFPYGIYTIPEISSCGITEQEAISREYDYEVGRAYYYEIAASHIYGSNNMGMIKIIFHKQTLEILGVHIVGREATEVIHIGQVAMSFNSKIDFFIDQIFNYPTYAEGYRIAALNGYNRLKKN